MAEPKILLQSKDVEPQDPLDLKIHKSTETCSALSEGKN